MPHTQNAILSRTSPVDLKDLEPYLRLVELPHGREIAHSRGRVSEVYFPHGGILSCVVELENGWTIETGMIGRDGVFGAMQAIDGRLSLHTVKVQVPGRATVVDANVVKNVADSSPDFRALIVKYDQFFLGQVQQHTACNALHSIEQRTCKWLGRMYDLVGTDLPLTQEFLAQMMGVRRTSVTSVATQLQAEGLISYRRGKINILDIDRLKRRTCECHSSIQEQYIAIFGRTPSATFRHDRSLEPGTAAE
jgi:CRP-like cAMP-binding protein